MGKLFFLFVPLLILAVPALSWGKNRAVVLGYSAEWFDSQYPTAQYNYENLTHIARAFIEPNADGTLKIPDHFFDPDLAKGCKAHGVKLLASIGGESAGDSNWKAISQDPQKTQKFLDELEKQINGHGWDGVDIDWEPGPQKDKDQKLYTDLMLNLRKRFPHWIITTALMAGESWVSHVSWNTVIPQVDFVNLMTYPLAGPWTGHSAHQTNLYPSAIPQGDGGMSVDGLIRNLTQNFHVPSRKIVLGLAFWGMKFPTEHLGDQLGTLGPNDMGGYPYKQIPALEQDPSYRKLWDEKAEVPYLEKVKDGHVTISYDDPKSVGLKVAYAKKNKLGGVMFWHIGSDALDGKVLLQSELRWK